MEVPMTLEFGWCLQLHLQVKDTPWLTTLPNAAAICLVGRPNVVVEMSQQSALTDENRTRRRNAAAHFADSFGQTFENAKNFLELRSRLFWIENQLTHLSHCATNLGQKKYSKD